MTVSTWRRLVQRLRAERTVQRRIVMSLLLTSFASGMLSIALASQPSPARAAAPTSKPVMVSKVVSRTHLVAGEDVAIDKRKVTVSADVTQNLRDRQGVNISWSGAHPSGGVHFDVNSINAPSTEYPFVILQCRGKETASKPLSPETCFTPTPNYRYRSPFRSLFPPYRVDRYETAAHRKQDVDVPKPLPDSCDTGFGAQRYVPFLAQDGTRYYGGDSGCAGLAPEQSVVSNPLSPPNATFATTGSDGRGSARFIVQDGTDNASLGCSDKVACSLVMIPIEGISCDPAGASGNLPPVDRPTGSNLTAATRECMQNGFYRAGVPSGDPGTEDPSSQLAVNGLLWWSESNWRNRMSVPISFATTAASCSLTGGPAAIGVYGSQYLSQAVAQWAPATCANNKLFQLQYTQTSEVQAKNLLSTSVTNGQYLGVKSAFQGGPPQVPFKNPIVQAPTALSGYGIGYVVDDANGREITNLKLNARLLAKLLSMSYPTYPAIKSDWARTTPKSSDDTNEYKKYNTSSNNPLTMSVDPEFLALNPDAKTPFINQLESASTLFAMSSDADAMSALTSYINADPEARAWLNGKADPWGMVVNPNYRGISLPVTSWPLLDSLYDSLGNDCIADGKFPALPLVAAPVSDPSQITFNMQLGISNSQTNCTVTGGTNSADSRRLAASGREAPGIRFLVGLVSLADADRYQIDIASLQSHNANTGNGKFSTAAGRTFVAPTDASLVAAGRLLKADDRLGTWTLPYRTMVTSNAGKTAYPGTMLMSTDVPTSGLTHSDASAYAKLLRFVSGPGQIRGSANGQLAGGFAPLSAADGLGPLHAYTVLAATAVEQQRGARVAPSDPRLTLPTTSQGGTSDDNQRAGSDGNGSPIGGRGSGQGGDSAQGGGAQVGATTSSSPAKRPGASTQAGSAPPPTAIALVPTARTKDASPGIAAAVVPALAIIALVTGSMALYASGLTGRRR